MGKRQNDGTKAWTIGEVATAFHVSTHTVRMWVDQGLLRCYRIPVAGGGGHRRFEPDALVRFAREANLPVPPKLGRSGDAVLPEVA